MRSVMLMERWCGSKIFRLSTLYIAVINLARLCPNTPPYLALSTTGEKIELKRLGELELGILRCPISPVVPNSISM
jgi:hypothetical protein